MNKVNRRDRRNAKKDILNNIDNFITNMHINLQKTFLYVLINEFNFDFKKIDVLTAKVSEATTEVAEGKLTFDEMGKKINEVCDKKEEPVKKTRKRSKNENKSE